MLRTAAVLLALGAAVAATPASAASFDCRKAASPEEKAVCASDTLSKLDDLLGKAYKQAKASDADTALKASRDFRADRAECGADESCLIASYIGGLRNLEFAGSDVKTPADVTAKTIAAGKAKALPGLPKKVGQCTLTAVASVHPRLGDSESKTFEDADFDTGTGIDYANEGYQVSYDREPALIASKSGDKVVMCLVALPHDCPAGDDRGKLYTVTNLRTNATWTLADSQHMCGGA